MKRQFQEIHVPAEYRNMLRELGYEGDTSYWDIKQWFWEKHGIEINYLSSKDRKIWCGGWKNDRVFDSTGNKFDSPITAEIEGIKKAIHNLHSKINK